MLYYRLSARGAAAIEAWLLRLQLTTCRVAVAVTETRVMDDSYNRPTVRLDSFYQRLILPAD